MRASIFQFCKRCLLPGHVLGLLFLFVLLSPAVGQPTLYYHAGSTRKISQLTGDIDRPFNIPTRSLTATNTALDATDLGSTFEHKGSLYFLFGDTWGGRNGLLDTFGVSQSTSAWNLEMDVPTAPDNKWRAILPPGLNHAEFCVPSHGISLNSIIYVVFTQPNSNGDIMKQSYMIASADDGVSWQTLYRLDNGQDSAPRFVNVWLEQSGDYIYMFGSGAYRASSPLLVRAPAALFPQKSSWEYFVGRLPNGDPIWSSQALAAVPLFNHNELGEFSCSYIETLGCWVMLYNSGNPRGITMRTAAQPWGPWSGGTVIMQPDQAQAYGNFMHINHETEKRDLFHDPGRENEWGGEYGPYIIPRFTAGDASRCELFYTMSTWNPYQVILMRSIVSASPPPAAPPTQPLTLGHDKWSRYPSNIGTPFTRNGRPHLTTYDGDEMMGWLWQSLPANATSVSFLLHGGHAEIFLLENSSGLPASGSIYSVDTNLRSGAYGRIVRRAIGVDDNTDDIAWTWDLRPFDRSSLTLVVMDSLESSWGFLSFSDIRVTVPQAQASVEDWTLY